MPQNKQAFYQAIEEMGARFSQIEENFSYYYFGNIKRIFEEKYQTLIALSTDQEDVDWIRSCQVKMIDFYNKALEKNYNDLAEIKRTMRTYFPSSHRIILPLDEKGNPVKAWVVDVKDGRPVFDRAQTFEEIEKAMDKGSNARWNLRSFIPEGLSIFQQLDLAKKLKQRESLGSFTPTPNYDTEGISREQSEARAWENYAIEHGLYQSVNYDRYLEEIISALEVCVEFFHRAFAIV